MNAGAYGEDMAGRIQSVKIWCAGEVQMRKREGLEFGYRTSPFQGRAACRINVAPSDLNANSAELGEKETGFRSSAPGSPLILAAELSFVPGEREEILAQMRESLRRRADAQPLAEPNAGSVFRNPPGDFAARLIEAAGWKGRRRGGAQVSEKHSNFIVNTGDATADDVLHLIQEIRQDVWEKFSIRLQPEIRYVATQEEAGLWPWIAM